MIEDSNTSRLPRGWALFNLDDIVADGRDSIKRGPFGSTIKKAYFVPSGYKVYEQQNVIYDDFTLGNYYIDAKKFEELRGFELKSGDFVISCSGTIGRAAIVPINIQRGVINQALLKLTLNKALVDSKYFYYLFTSEVMQNRINANTRGTAITNIASVKALKSIGFPIAPLNEQKLVVAKIEELLSFLGAGVESLRKVKTLLKRYRQAVLKYAFEGKLTEEWRKTHKDQIEPAQKLLEQIEQERRKNATTKHKEPPPIDTAGLSKIPDDWVWTSIDALFDVGSGGTPSRKKPEYWNGDIPWVTSGEVAFSEIKDTKEYITQEGLENSSAKLYPSGTVLLALYGEGKTRGQVAILRLPATTNQAIACILCSSSPIPPEYVFWWLCYRYYETRSIGEGANQPNMYLHHVRRMPIPLAPLMEQRVIVERIKHDLSKVDKMEDTIEQSFQRSEKLRQSILKRAFEGKLVSQDPTDEPANRLLARIKEVKTKHENRTNDVVAEEKKGLMRYVK